MSKKVHKRPQHSPMPTGEELLHNPLWNKGTAFTNEERKALGLEGLLPPRVSTEQEQVVRVMENYYKKDNDLERYIHLISLQDRNETLFYRVVVDHIEELMPIIYTPTVGKACQEYGHIFRRSRGIFLSARKHKGRLAQILRNWPEKDIRVIVVTDGERILGLGDLGANGMGIPVGKLSLYTACAGIDPSRTLPVTLDAGTNNEALRHDPLYIGDMAPRIRGEEYDEFVDEFITAVQEVFPETLVQFEDFATQNAFNLLHRYRDRCCCFNDDIQGTAGVTLAGLNSALRITGGKLEEQKILFFGAGAAAVGIGDLIVGAMVNRGLDKEKAKEQLWFHDSKGLVVASRKDLAQHKLAYAHEHDQMSDLLSSIKSLEPTVLVGVSGQGRTFTKDVLRTMAELNERPVVFALSNPTSKAECTAEEAYTHTGGRVVFATGSPFDPVTLDGKTYVTGQGNNAYVFPGIGLGIVASGATRVPDEMFFAAAESLAHQVADEDLAQGCIFPPLAKIRGVSAQIATAVAKVAYDQGLARGEEPDDLYEHIRSHMFEPDYRSYV